MAKTGIRVKQLPAVADLILGSCVIMRRVCGYANCRCAKGHKHRSLYISQYHKGGPRMVYIPKENEDEAMRLVNNYLALKSAITRTSEANLKRLIIRKKR